MRYWGLLLRRNFVLIEGFGLYRLPYSVFLRTDLVFQYVFEDVDLNVLRRVRHRVVTEVRAMITVCLVVGVNDGNVRSFLLQRL